jgi:hypothetical protein
MHSRCSYRIGLSNRIDIDEVANSVHRCNKCNPGDRVLESTSAKGKIRGTARQLVEHSFQFAEEARLADDRVATQAFLQSAEHYVRLSNPVRHSEGHPLKQQTHA